MFHRILFLFAFLTLANPSLAEACAPSATSCDFYGCLEAQVRCGDRGYLDRFATPLCEKYREHEEFASEKLKAWYPKVRFCLQEALVDLNDVSTCGELQTKALDSHADCYFETGFCELDWSDRIEIGRLAGRNIFQQAVLKQGFRVLERCRKTRH